MTLFDFPIFRMHSSACFGVSIFFDDIPNVGLILYVGKSPNNAHCNRVNEQVEPPVPILEDFA